ncbi:MAG: methyltransferase domain-containing protein [Chloroflexi bacterium]|nr:methyltransferase domain-containing protein [Chloroflexota bacterium]
MSKSFRVEKESVIHLYRRRARRYNFTANLYYLIGFRLQAYREKAVLALNLHPGDTVVEIGCGTGGNFPLLQQAVGPNGKIIGVDITDAMLSQARKRVEENRWSNVELVQSDAASFQFPNGVGGILSTFAITLAPDFDKIIKSGARSLAPGKRWVIADFKMPSNRFVHLAPLLVFLTRPFGVSMELASRHPWESISNYLANTSVTELYGGMVYIAVGHR